MLPSDGSTLGGMGAAAGLIGGASRVSRVTTNTPATANIVTAIPASACRRRGRLAVDNIASLAAPLTLVPRADGDVATGSGACTVAARTPCPLRLWLGRGAVLAAIRLAIDGAHASYGEGFSNCFGDGMPGCALTDLVLVGSKPLGDGRWGHSGHSELTGNVSEWLLDWEAGYISPCTDCANLTVAEHRIIRGGGFVDKVTTLPPSIQPALLRTAFRDANFPFEARGPKAGVRCARAL